MVGYGRFNVLFNAEVEQHNKQNGNLEGNHNFSQKGKNRKQEASKSKARSTIESALAFLEEQEGIGKKRSRVNLSAIDIRITDYVPLLPEPDYERVVYLRQGGNFSFCEQFVETIHYGADFFNGIIVKNFTDFPDEFFGDLFKHLAKTPFPNKAVALTSFTLPKTCPWPRSDYLTELPRHMEPKVIRKRDLVNPMKAECVGFVEKEERVVTLSCRSFNAHPSGTSDRVMYQLQNKHTNTMFYVKMWYDPAIGSRCYESVERVTVRRETGTMQSDAGI